MRSSPFLPTYLLLSLLALLACSDEDESTSAPPSNTAGGSSQAGSGGSSAGSGGTSAGSGGTSAGSGGTDAGNGGSPAGSGGDGGAAGNAGLGGQAGNGGAAGSGGGITCLPPDAYSKVLTLQASSPLCVTRVYKTPLSSFGFAFAATWGRHGGPLSTDTSSGAEVRRWQVPQDPQGAMTSEAPVKVKIDGLPEKIFFGPALDIPFQNWTLISYTGSSPEFAGEVIAMDSQLTEVKARNPVNGWFAATALPGATDRVVFTALSPVLTAPSNTSDNGLYYVEPCNATAILKAGCGASGKLGGWESNSGPVAVDEAGHLFAALSTFGGNQQVRAFLPAQAAGSTLVEGLTILTNTDFSTSLAALGNPDGKGGHLVVQSSDSTTFAAKPAQLFSYTVSNGKMSATALGEGGFSAKAAGASPVVFSSGDGRLWVATDGEDGAYFVVLERK
ncbi:MAG: hypothetical protein RMJ98_03715 [Myxococcales bacterium]|nr:hypothetical protein [Polyangiaceae bacterium]MDW8248396.1 hypothetical protein [Myxococcales bacterium]